MTKKYTFIQWHGPPLNRVGWGFPGFMFRRLVPSIQGNWVYGWSTRKGHKAPSIHCDRDHKTSRLCKPGDWIIVDEDGQYFRDLEYLQKFKT